MEEPKFCGISESQSRAIIAIAESVGSGGINSTVTVYEDEKPTKKWLIVVTRMQMGADHD